VQHWAWVNSTTLGEKTDQRVDYYYDSNPCKRFDLYRAEHVGTSRRRNFVLGNIGENCVYQYSLQFGGRVTSQRMSWKIDDAPGQPGPQTFNMDAA